MDTFNKRNLQQFYDLEEGEIIEEEDEIRILENIDNSFYNCLQDPPTYPVKSDHRYKSNKDRKGRYPSDYISPRHSYESEYSLHPYSKFRRKELKHPKISSSSKHESVKKYRERSKSPSWSSSGSTCSCSSCSSSSSDSESPKASQLPSRLKDGYHHSKSSIKPNQEGKEPINQRVSSSSKNVKKKTYKISKPVDSKNTNNNNHTEPKPKKKSEVKNSKNQVSETGKASISKRSIPLTNFSFHLPASKLEDISSTDSCSNDSLSQTVLRDKDAVKTKVVPGSLGEMLLKKQLKCKIKRDYKLTNDSTSLNKLLNKKINSIKDNENNSVKENEKCEVVDLCQEEDDDDDDDDDELTLRIKALESAMKSRQLNSSGDLNSNQSSAFTQSDQNAASFKPFKMSGKKIYPDNIHVLKNEYENDSEYDAKDSVQNADCKMFSPGKEPEENMDKNELDYPKREKEDLDKISDKHLSEADYICNKSELLGSNKCEITSVDMDISNDSFSGSATPGENNEIVMNENSCGTAIANQQSSKDPSLPIPIEWAYMMPPPPQPDQPDNNLNSISNWCFNQNMYIQSMQDSVNETSSPSTWNVTDGNAIAESYSNPYYYPPLQMGKDENYDKDFRNENQDDYYNLKCGQSNDSTLTVELRDSHAEQYKSFMSTVMTHNNCQSSVAKKEVHRDLVNIPLEPSAQCVNPFVTGGSEKKNSKRRGRRRRRSSKRSGSGETGGISGTLKSSENLVGKVDAGKRNLVDEEDEDMLRALLLNDMTLKNKSKSQGISSCVGNEIQELDKDLFSGTISQGLHKTITLNNKVKSLKSSSPSRNQFQKLSDFNKEKKNKWLTERKLSNVTIVKQTSDPNKESSLLHGFSLSKFPPVKPVIISINNDSDSDVEQEEIHKENFRDNEQLLSGIDSLLKSCRNKLSLNSQNANTPRSSNQSPIDHEKFKSIGGTPVLQTPKGVTHLSKEKQMEYRKLKQLMISKKKALLMKKRNLSSKNITALTRDGKENISAVNRFAREKIKEDGVEIDQQSCSIAVFNEVAIKLDCPSSDNDSDMLKMENTKEGSSKEVNQRMLDTSVDSESHAENLTEGQNMTIATVRNVIFSTESILPITENIKTCVERKFSIDEFVNPFSEKKMLSTEKVMPSTMVENENKIPCTEKVKHINASTMNITGSKMPVIENKILNTENVISTTEIEMSSTEIVTSTTENVTPTTENVLPTTENVLPTAENLMPIDDNVMPTTENVTPTTENLMPIDDNVMPTTENVLPIDDNVMPTTENVMPTTENVMPTTENVMPTTQNVLPTTENAMPTTENVMPIAENVKPITEMEMSISENVVSTPEGVDNLSQICENDNPTSIELSEHNECANMHQISEDSSSSDSESSSSSEDSDSNDSEDEFSSLSVKGCLSLVQGSKREETEINLRNILLQKRLEKFRLKENDQQMSLETGKDVSQKLRVEINKDCSGDSSSGDFINEFYSTVVSANENVADDNIEVGSHSSSVIKSGKVDKNHPKFDDKGIVETTVKKGLENSMYKDVKDNEDRNVSVYHSTSDENLKMDHPLGSTHKHKLSLEGKEGNFKNMVKENDPINKTVKAFLTQLQVNKSTSFKNDNLHSIRNKPSSLSTLRLVRSPKPLVSSEHSLTSEKKKLLENMDKKNVPQSFIRILGGVNTKLSSVKSLSSQISTLYKESMMDELACQNKFTEIIKLLSQINLLRKERKEKTASISSNFVKVTSMLQKLNEEMNCLSRWETFVQKNYSAKEELLSNIKKSKKEGELMYNHSALEVKKLKESVKLLSSQENILSKTFSKPLDNATQKRNPSSSPVHQRLSPKTKLFKLDNRVFKRQVEDAGGGKQKIQDIRVSRLTSVVSGNAISSDEKSPSFVSKQIQSSYRVETENQRAEADHQSVETEHHENDKFAGDLVLCPYDLLGRCNDDQCVYFHMSVTAGQVRSPVHSSKSSISYSNNFSKIKKISSKLDSDHLKLKNINESYDEKCSKIDEISSETNELPIPHKESPNEIKETVAEDCKVREGPDLSIPCTQASIQDRIDCFNQIACDMTAGNSELSQISECLPLMTSENSNYLDETSENSELNKSVSDISISLKKATEKPEHLETKRRHCKRRILCRNSKKRKNDDSSSFISVSSRNDLSGKVDTTMGNMVQEESIVNLTPPIRRSRSILDRNSKKRKYDNTSSSISVPSRSDLNGKVYTSMGNMEQEESNVNLTSPITSKTQNKLRKTLPPSKKTVKLRRLRKEVGNSAPLARVLRSSKRNGKQLRR